jgi:hypothetical protein
MDKDIYLKPRINKSNGQINFSIPKNSLPKKVKEKLPKLKGINFKLDNLDF